MLFLCFPSPSFNPPPHHGLGSPNWYPYVPSSQTRIFSTSNARGLATRPDAKFAILGGGSFGLAISHVLSRNEVSCCSQVGRNGVSGIVMRHDSVHSHHHHNDDTYYCLLNLNYPPPVQVPSSILVRSKEVAKKLNEVSYHYCGIICFPFWL